MLAKHIQQELAQPKSYQPITHGWLVASLLAGICLLSVPFYFIAKIFKR